MLNLLPYVSALPGLVLISNGKVKILIFKNFNGNLHLSRRQRVMWLYGLESLMVSHTLPTSVLMVIVVVKI